MIVLSMVIFSIMFIALPYLLITGAVLIAYLFKKNRALGIILIILFCIPASLVFLAWLTSPMKPSKSDIIGQYEVDRSRYPGKQADWQHATYSLEITPSKVIVSDSRTKTKWDYPIAWFYQAEYRWNFTDPGMRHHIVAGGPDIYREPFGYYYVFKSPLYGDVFFKKK